MEALELLQIFQELVPLMLVAALVDTILPHLHRQEAQEEAAHLALHQAVTGQRGQQTPAAVEAVL